VNWAKLPHNPTRLLSFRRLLWQHIGCRQLTLEYNTLVTFALRELSICLKVEAYRRLESRATNCPYRKSQEIGPAWALSSLVRWFVQGTILQSARYNPGVPLRAESTLRRQG
jgi:hypothetical protein